jgi:hypothetical protein
MSRLSWGLVRGRTVAPHPLSRLSTRRRVSVCVGVPGLSWPGALVL